MKKNQKIDFSTDWSEIVKKVEKIIPPSAFDTFINPLAPQNINLQTGESWFEAPSAVVKSRVEARYLPAIEECLSEFYNKKIMVFLEDPSEFSKDTDEKFKQIQRALMPNSSPWLDPTSTFENFVVDESNEFAYQICRAIAEDPNKKDANPFFLYSNSGLGKTHLMNALVLFIKQITPKRRVRFERTQTYISDFIAASSNNEMTAFRKKYQDCDILILDDIQLLGSGNKEKTHEEFFYTFNSLYENKKQLIFSADRAPSQIDALDRRITSRLGAGVQISISYPSIETRIKILQNKAAAEEIKNNKTIDEVIDLIARNISQNIRELLGAFTNVINYVKQNPDASDLAMFRYLLKDVISDSTLPPSAEKIKAYIATKNNLSMKELESPTRKKEISEARQIAIFLIKEQTDLSFPQIGKLFGGRDHSTIMHSYNKIKEKVKSNKAFQNLIFSYQKALKNV